MQQLIISIALSFTAVHNACKELIKREISEGEEGVIAVHRDRLNISTYIGSFSGQEKRK